MELYISGAMYGGVPVKVYPSRTPRVHLLSPKSVILTCHLGPFCATRIF